MSTPSGTQASTKSGETTSSKSSKSGYDHLDINKLYKGKTTEPVAKTVTQKHGMQTLGKAPPARRGGSIVVKSETTTSDVGKSSASSQPTSLPPNIGQPPLHPPGWSNSTLNHPQGPPSPHSAPNVPTTGPAMHDKNWSGGPDRKGNFPSAAAQDSMQRFAQEFPSLDSGGDTGKGPTANASGTSNAGHQQMSKSNQDNQYGPGPILRPQTEGSWTQGGGRGMPRPPGPPPPGVSSREFGPERPNLGGPTPRVPGEKGDVGLDGFRGPQPPMSLGQGGHPPPPLGAFPMQFPRPPYMYPNAGGPMPVPGFYPPGPGMPRYGMPIPPGAPPPQSHAPDVHREPRGRGPPPQPMRPASHFATKPIIKQEELERMDELGTQDGSWAAVQDDIDYNKRISFSDDEGEDKGKENNHSGRLGVSKAERSAPRQDSEKRDDDRDREPRRSVKILERQQPPPMNDRNDREQRDSRYESEREPISGRFDYDNEEDWKRKSASGFEAKERDPRDRAPGRGRIREEESWRSGGNNRFQEEDPRNKKVPVQVNRADPRVGPPEFGKQFQSNLPPRLQRHHQQPPMFSQSSNQRKTPSPVPTSTSGNSVNKEREYRDRDREWERDRDRPAYKILERNRGDSESSKESSRDIRERRFGNSNDNDSGRSRDKDPSKRLSSDSGRFKDEDSDSKMSPKEKSDVDSSDNYHAESRKQDEAKSSFRSRPTGFTSSWADEVDDEEYNSRDDDDTRKGLPRDSNSSYIKRDTVYPEERRPRENTVPRRVIIQQTKVENMRSDVKPEPIVETKPEPVKMPEKPAEKVKSTAWGERESAREKPKPDTEAPQKESTPTQDNDLESHSSDKDQSYQKPVSKPDGLNDTKLESNKEDHEKTQPGLERKGSREKIEKDRHYDRYGSGGRFDERKQDKPSIPEQNRNNDNRGSNLRDNRPKARRMDSYESKRENRTPDRDQFSGPTRNVNNDGSLPSSVSSRSSQEKDQDKSKSNIDKSRSGDRLESLKDKTAGEKHDKEDFRREREFDKDKDFDRHNRNDRDDFDSQRDGRSHRGGRGRERGGYGIYQPRGGSSWGSEPKGRNRGRGSSRDFYDPKPKRGEGDKDDKSFGKDEQMRSNESDGGKEKPQDKGSDLSSKGSAEDLGNKRRDKDQMSHDKKGNKSPGTSRRNANRGGARLQGYGPPSDKTPFSSNQSHKDDDQKEKPSEPQVNKSGPVPLMALGDISPPNLQNKSRHHGGAGGRDAPGNRGRGVPPRMQRDEYSFRDQRGSGGNKRGVGRSGDAKPLMSINSNDVEGNEWESESESGDDESKRSGQQQTRKEGVSSKSVSDRFRQSQNNSRNGSVKSGLTLKESTSSNTFDNSLESANNNKGKGSSTKKSRGSSSNFEIDSYSSGHQTSQEVTQQGGSSDNQEQADSEGSGYQKKTPSISKQSSDKSSASSGGQKNSRQEPKPSSKDRRVKNQPYDPRPNSSKSLPPRFFSSKEVLPPKTNTNNLGQPSNSGKSSSDEQQNQTVGTWEKTVSQPQSKESAPQPQPVTQPNNSAVSVMEMKDSHDSKASIATTQHQSAAVVSNTSILDAGNPPVKTMIFENTHFKNINNTTSSSSKPSGKPIEQKKDGVPANIELGKDLQLGFGKVVGEENTDIDFNTFNDGTSAASNASQLNQSISNQQTSKPMAIGPSSRSFVSHQPSPISPQAADLNEKVQSVKRIWDVSPAMPSVAEQSSVCGSDDNSFHGGFNTDTFKGSENSSRDFSSSLQQPTSGYAPGSSPALSAISKPESSSSPTSANLRISKPQQQSSLDNQGQSGISSPFGGYSMPQPQGSNAFSGMPAVPSPPSGSVMYGASQTLHAVAPASGIYQAFSHVDAAPVVGASNRQYHQYPTQAAGGHYGLFLSQTHTPMDYQSMSSYQHQHQQGSQGPPGQGNQNSRISPGPMTTSGGGNSAGVIISSASSLMSMKAQSATGSHPNMPHQVVPGSQQGYSQLSHHHPAAAMSHPQHHLGAVGPVKGGYSQSGLATPSQVFIPFDASQTSMIGLGQNFLSSAMRSGPPGGPPPPATPPVQALQASSTYYSGSSGNQSGVYPTGSTQGNSLQQLHVAVAPNPQGLPGLHNANPQFGLQYPTQLNLQSYNQQAAASTVSALNLGNQLIRNPGPASHSFMKQPGIDLVQQSQMKSTHDASIMNQNTWTSGFTLSNQSFHAGNKTGTNADRNSGNNIGNQRKGNSHSGNVPNMKYMSNQGPGGYSGQVQQQ